MTSWLQDDEEAMEAMSEVEFESMLMSMSLDESYYQVQGGLIPEYMWQSGLLNPYAAGFVDGLWETVEGTWGIVEFLAAWQPNNFSPEAMEIRRQSYEFVEFLNKLAQSEELRTQAWNNIKEAFSEYVDETAALDNQAMYNQGKLLFDVVTLFIGIGEVKAILKGEQLTIGIVALIQAVPKNLSKFVFKVRQFGLAVVKSGNKLLIKDGAVEIASIADNVLSPTVFLDDGQEVLREAGQTLVKSTEGKHGFLSEVGILVRKWTDLTSAEVKNLYSKLSRTELSFSSKTTRTQAEVLDELNANPNTINPYNFAYDIEDIVLSQEALFVRVHRTGNPNRPWLVSIEDFKSFTSQDDMVKKLALPILDNGGSTILPTDLSLVKLPVGTKIRKSVARPQDWPGQGHQPGGSLQYEIRDNLAIPRSWFQSVDRLDNIFN